MTDEVAAVWATIAHVAQARVALLEQGLRALEEGAADLDERCAVAHDECHKLVGSLDSYGITGGSTLALQAALLFESRTVAGLRPLVEQLRALVAPT